MKMLAKPKSEPAKFDKLVTTWAIIEARPTLPALIAVASATAIDDTEPVARGLARVAQESGQRTGYLYLGAHPRPVDEQRVLSYANLAITGRPSMRESFDYALDAWRHSYDVIVIELPELAACELGAHVARLAEGVIVGVFPGRKVMPADRELTALFGQLSASVIGVVKTPTTVSSATPSPASSRSPSSLIFPVRQP